MGWDASFSPTPHTRENETATTARPFCHAIGAQNKEATRGTRLGPVWATHGTQRHGRVRHRPAPGLGPACVPRPGDDVRVYAQASLATLGPIPSPSAARPRKGRLWHVGRLVRRLSPTPGARGACAAAVGL